MLCPNISILYWQVLWFCCAQIITHIPELIMIFLNVLFLVNFWLDGVSFLLRLCLWFVFNFEQDSVLVSVLFGSLCFRCDNFLSCFLNVLQSESTHFSSFSLGLETADLCVDVVQIFLVVVRGFCWRNVDGTKISGSG